jgi:glucokinase
MPAEHVIAVDLGRSKVAAAVVGPDYQLHARTEEDVSDIANFRELLEVAVRAAARLAQEHEASAVGLSIAGDVDVARGVVYYRRPTAADREHVGSGPLEEIELVKEVSKRTGLRSGLENDGIAALRAEWRAGAAQGLTDVASLIIGTHIGSAVISGGQIVRRSTSGPQLGAIVSSSDGGTVIVGDQCSGTGIAQAYGAANAAVVIERAREGDQRALAVLAGAGFWLGILLASTVNVFAPEAVVLGGGVMAAADLILPAAQQVLARDTTLPTVQATEVDLRLAHFGGEAGLIGAAVCAFELEEA